MCQITLVSIRFLFLFRPVKDKEEIQVNERKCDYISSFQLKHWKTVAVAVILYIQCPTYAHFIVHQWKIFSFEFLFLWDLIRYHGAVRY